MALPKDATLLRMRRGFHIYCIFSPDFWNPMMDRNPACERTDKTACCGQIQ